MKHKLCDMCETDYAEKTYKDNVNTYYVCKECLELGLSTDWYKREENN